MEKEQTSGHLCALITILIWGTTFISTKVLLTGFRPVEILFLRTLIGLLALTLIRPQRIKDLSLRQEALFAAAGLCGVCLYFLMENIALTYTMASNVSVIVSLSPFFIAVLSHLVTREERLRPRFFAGFAVAMAGIVLISFPGSGLELNPVGDLLALAAAFVWACYSLITKRISTWGYHIILTTRHIFFYGVLFMLPALLPLGFRPEAALLAQPVYLLNLLYLGLGASALCFVTWNWAVKTLGPLKTSIYIYVIPVITVITSALILGERLTLLSGLGTLLTLAGLALSQGRTETKGQG